MEEKNLNARAEHIGGIVRARFEKLAERSELVADVRGLGAMIGLELCHQRDKRRPATAEVAAITASCRSRGVLVLPAGLDGNVLRVLSPLVITDDDLDRGLRVIEDSVVALSEKAPA
jgi:4-aminobutyrate aminotransferase/(S)-3-amino-2-methylpropionate transaminase